MLRHQADILRESFRPKEYQHDGLIYVWIALIGMIAVLKFQNTWDDKFYIHFGGSLEY